jgi:glucose/mannose transport system permease protein
MSNAIAITITPAARIGRILVYSTLILAACFYLLPLFVMLITSLKSLDEIRLGNLLALPDEVTFDAWQIAWSSACTGVTCDGLKPYFWNSVLIAVPSVFISTAMGAFNGYVMTKWRFRGSELFFGMLLIGTMIPFQVVLLPMAQTLGMLGLSGTIYGLILVHVVYGIAFTTLFFRNYYVSVPDELVRAAMIDGAGFFKIFWRIILPISIPIVVGMTSSSGWSTRRAISNHSPLASTIWSTPQPASNNTTSIWRRQLSLPCPPC